MKIKNFDNFDINEGAQGGGNKFIFVRFGNAPDPRVMKYFAEMATRNPKPTIMKGPGSIITMFETPKTKEDIIQGFDALGVSYNLYQIIHTSGGGTGPSLVARAAVPNKAEIERQMHAAVAAEDWEKAAKLRDQLAEMGEGVPHSSESKVYSFENFKLNEAEEVFVNGTNTQEFYKLVSELIDHEIEECEGGEEGEMYNTCKKIKDYLVTNKFYVAPEKEEGAGDDEEKPTNEDTVDNDPHDYSGLVMQLEKYWDAIYLDKIAPMLSSKYDPNGEKPEYLTFDERVSALDFYFDDDATSQIQNILQNWLKQNGGSQEEFCKYFVKSFEIKF